MVQAIINISEHTNRIITIIKVRDGLKDKSEAIEKMVNEYENAVLSPQLRTEVVERVHARMERGKFVKVDDFSTFYNSKNKR